MDIVVNLPEQARFYGLEHLLGNPESWIRHGTMKIRATEDKLMEAVSYCKEEIRKRAFYRNIHGYFPRKGNNNGSRTIQQLKH